MNFDHRMLLLRGRRSNGFSFCHKVLYVVAPMISGHLAPSYINGALSRTMSRMLIKKAAHKKGKPSKKTSASDEVQGAVAYYERSSTAITSNNFKRSKFFENIINVKYRVYFTDGSQQISI